MVAHFPPSCILYPTPSPHGTITPHYPLLLILKLGSFCVVYLQAKILIIKINDCIIKLLTLQHSVIVTFVCTHHKKIS